MINGCMDDYVPFTISSISLIELENIKSSRLKDEQTKYNARKASHWLDDNRDKYNVVIYTQQMLENKDIEDTPDNRIIACAATIDDVVFITNDLNCRLIAEKIFSLNVHTFKENEQDYTGFKEVVLSEKDMAYLYEHMNENTYDLLCNQYLIIKNENNEIVDKVKWTNDGFVAIKIGTIKSNLFGTVKPYCGDIYQQLILDSFSNNQITMVKGKAGTGKSFLAIGYLIYLLEKHKIDKIVIFCNTVPTVNSARLGFLPGSQLEKLIDSSLGNMLGSKLGDKIEVERLVEDGKLMLLPMCDIRGFDTSGMNCGVYITEAQNMDVSLMKLALQRIGSDSICIIDGDYLAQLDLSDYAGRNNGMRRMSEVFRGEDLYGEVELQNIYRSRIASIAERM